MESYMIDDDSKEVKQVSETLLYKSEDDPQPFKVLKKTTDGGYLSHVQIACNGRILLLNSAC